MKSFFLIIFLSACFCISNGQSQDRKTGYMASPFRVVYAAQAFKSSGDSLKSLDNLIYTDEVTIRENGFLSLIHRTGFPVEITGDSVLNIQAMRASIFSGGKFKEVENTHWPVIEQLFTRTEPEWRQYNVKSLSGAVHRLPTRIDILYPPIMSRQLFFQDELCLKWKSDRRGPYIVSLTTIFGDALASWTVDEDSLYVPVEEIREKLPAEEEKLVLQISCAGGRSEDFVLQKLSDHSIAFPFSCQPTNATAALIAGLYIEGLDYQSYYRDAEKYYQLATTLSDEAFFKKMLQNFRERHSKR